MSKARTLADFISDGSEFADGTISVAEVSGAAPLASPSFTGNATFDTNTLYIDGTNNRVGFGTTSPARSVTIFEDDQPVFQITNNTSGTANTRGLIQYIANGTTDAVFDNQGSGSGGMFRFMQAGTERLRMTTSAFVVNEGGNDYDFRVESDTNANALWMDASVSKVKINTTLGGVNNTKNLVVGDGLADGNTYTNGAWEKVAVFLPNDNGTGSDAGFVIGGGSYGTSGTETLRLQFSNTHGNSGRPVGWHIRSYTNLDANNYDQSLVFDKVTRSGSGNPTVSPVFEMNAYDTVFNQYGYDRDFRVESDTNTHALFLDAGNSVVGLNISEPHLYYANDLVVGATTQGGITIAGGSSDVNYMMFADLSYGDGRYRGYIEYNHGSDNFAIAASAQHRLNLSSAEAVFNEGSYNTDFRIESDAYSHIMFVDASENRVSIGHNSSAGYGSGHVLAVAGGSTQFSNFGADVTMMIRGGNYTDPHTASILLSGGSGDNGYVKDWYVSSVASGGGGAINNDLKFRYLAGGSATQYEALKLRYNGEVIVNEEGYATHDFRVESDAYSTMFQVDAGNNWVSIGQAVPATGFDGDLIVMGSSASTATAPVRINRSTDGYLIRFMESNNTEGYISVSGSTVSYNGFAGRHESSGIPTTTARGTVVSTIDELDEYLSGPKQGQDRADHAKVEVSNTVGDPCVYGVVDDFTDDGSVNVVSVGIAPVRVTGSCAKGDLLESNGDGTAKVQSDDIIRSKTIGKVTIGNSDTGVKLVPCVMYCG